MTKNKNESTFSFEEFEEWGERFGLSMEDCAHLVGLSLSSLQKIKAGSSSGREVLRRLELVCRVPEVLAYQLKKQGKGLHHVKCEKLWEEGCKVRAGYVVMSR